MLRRVRAHGRGAGAAVAVALFAIPLGVLLAGALHAPGRPLPRGWDLLPGEPTLAAFERAFGLVPFAGQLANSLIVVAVAVPVSVAVASMAGFGMTLLDRRAHRWALAAALVLLVIPASAVWVPRFVIVSRLGLTDTLVPLMLPALMGTTPFAVLLCYWSSRRIPRDLVDAARLAGLGPLAIWWRVAVPLTRPTLAAAAAIVFVAHWGNFVDALLYLYSPENYTLPLGMSQLRLLGPTDQSTILAGALFVAIPAIAAFALVQRRFINATRRAGWLGG